MPQIIITRGGRPVGNPFIFSAQKDFIISIGRHPSNDIILDDPKRKISRHHAAVILGTDGHYYIQDLGSMNGIEVEGRTVACCRLNDGDSIRAGSFFLSFAAGHDKQSRFFVPILSESEAGKQQEERDRYLDLATEAHLNQSVLLARLSEEKRGIFQDISKRLQFLSDVNSILKDVLDSICHAVGADKGYIAQLETNGALWISTAFRIDLERGDAVPGLAQSWIDQVMNHEQPFVMNNFKGTGIGFALSPVWCGPNLIGMLYISRHGDGFSNEDMKFLSIVTEHTREPLMEARRVSTSGETVPEACTFRWKAGLVGNAKTEAMQDVYQLVEMLAGQDVNILLLGETGTGKEVVSRLIHERSTRRNGPFVAVELSALPSEEMAASELFGHVKGAFTGAVSDRRGKFELADQGTLFLDEIGDVNMEMQAKLRRAIENREIAKIGGEKTLSVDTRIVSATNRDLKAMITENAFREDLFERLGSVISLPPLRTRKEDIALLAHYFISLCSTTVKGVSPKALQLLLNYDWPRNVRELKNVIEESVARAQEKDMLYPWDLPERLQESKEEKLDGGTIMSMTTLKQKEYDEILKALEQTGWNVAQAAGILGISRQTLYNKMKTYELEKPGA